MIECRRDAKKLTAYIFNSPFQETVFVAYFDFYDVKKIFQHLTRRAFVGLASNTDVAFNIHNIA